MPPLRRIGLGVAARMAASALAVVSSQAVAAPSCPDVGFTIIEPRASPETRVVKSGPNQTLFIRRDALTTTADISEISVGQDPVDGVVLLKFKPAAAARLQDATTGRSGLRLALVADDEVLLAITWTGPYGIEPTGVQVSLGAGSARARGLVDAVHKCAGASGD